MSWDPNDPLDGYMPGPAYQPGHRPFGKPWPPEGSDISAWGSTRAVAALPTNPSYLVLTADNPTEIVRASSPIPVAWQVQMRVRPLDPLLSATPIVFLIDVGVGRVTWTEDPIQLGVSPDQPAADVQVVASLVTVRIRFAAPPSPQDGFLVHARLGTFSKNW